MLRFLARPATRLMERYLPDAFIFVLVLTLVAMVAALLTQPVTPLQLVQQWGDGFWRLLEFAMQMLLVLVTGYIMATTPLVSRLLERLAGIARGPGSAIVIVTLVSLAAAWLNWGFGLVVGALFAKALARRVQVDYRLLIASAYTGFVIWHGGISGSVPLTISTPGHFAEDQIGLIPTSATTFAGFNLLICALLFIFVPLINRLMMPAPDETVLVDPAMLADRRPVLAPPATPAEWLERSPILLWVIAVPGLVWILQHFITKGPMLNLNVVNFVFLFIGIALHRSPRDLLDSLDEGVRGGAGIVIQFPFYAGIMAIMTQSGLAVTLSEWFVAISTAETLPFWTLISAGIVNIFVPSGGGQWAVQAPVMIPAAQALGADMTRTVMAVAWGDAWTNLLQPFWALPMLGIAGLKPRDIMGFCMIQLVATGIIIGGVLYFF